jgi:hypothetical protein
MQFIKFSDSKKVPEPIEKTVSNKDWVYWGDDNLYPQFLIKLFYDSAYQSGIIDGKVKYITSAGFDVEYIDDESKVKFKRFENNKLADQDINAFIRALALDLEIFNALAIKVVKTNDGRLAYYESINVENVRVDQDKKIVFYSDNWAASEQTDEQGYREYPIYNPNSEDLVSVLYFATPSKNYEVSRNKAVTNVYGRPNYTGGIKDILSDIEISGYHYYELKNSFKGGTLITFTNGEPAEEERSTIESDYKEGLTPNENSGGIMINYVNGQDQVPNIQALNGNDLDKRYLMTEEAVRKKIFVAHGVTTPALFGIATQGSLGSKQELEVAFEIFKKVYIRDRQDIIETIVNYLLASFEVGATITLKEPETPFTTELQQTNTTLNQFKAETNEQKYLALAATLGVKADEFKGKILFSRAVDVNDNVDEVERELFNDFNGAKQKFNLSIGDKIMLLDWAKSGQVIDSDFLTEYANGSNGWNSTQIAIAYKRLVEGGYISPQGVLTQAGESIVSLSDKEAEAFTVYKYVEKPGVPKALSGSRSFCTAMLSLNRYYTREEIDQLSPLTEEKNAWSFRGGWYHNPVTKETTKSCRHTWQASIAVK